MTAIRKLRAWWRTLRNIVANYESDRRHILGNLERCEAVIRERTTAGVDVGFRDGHHVIVLGRYKNADYVNSFTIRDSDFVALVEQLRAMEKFARIRRVDAPPQFRAVFDRETLRSL